MVLILEFHRPISFHFQLLYLFLRHFLLPTLLILPISTRICSKLEGSSTTTARYIGAPWILLWERSIHIHDWIHSLRTRRRATSHRGGPLLLSGPFLFIAFRIESTGRKREKGRDSVVMLRVPSNRFQSGPPIRSPNKARGKYFHSNYAYIRAPPTSDHVTQWTPITYLAIPAITRNEWSFSIQKSYDYNGFLNYRILLPATNIYWN